MSCVRLRSRLVTRDVARQSHADDGKLGVAGFIRLESQPRANRRYPRQCCITLLYSGIYYIVCRIEEQ